MPSRRAYTHHHRLFDLRTQRDIHVRQAPGHGERGAGEQREAQAVGGLDHGLRLLEAEGELLVVEVRNCAPLVLKDLRALLKEIVAGQQNLPPVVAWVVILLDDRQHGVDGDAVSTTTQRLGNVAAQTEAELLRAGSAQIGVDRSPGFSGAGCVFTVRSLPRPPAIPLAELAGATLAPVIASW